MDYDAVAESGRNPVSKHQIDDSAWVWRMNRLARRGRPNLSCDTNFLGANGDRDFFPPCSADHEQD